MSYKLPELVSSLVSGHAEKLERGTTTGDARERVCTLAASAAAASRRSFSSRARFRMFWMPASPFGLSHDSHASLALMAFTTWASTWGCSDYASGGGNAPGATHHRHGLVDVGVLAASGLAQRSGS